jgi:ACS family hexuronate transporter-like MFS transporter
MLIFAMIVPLSPLAGLVPRASVAIAIASVIALAHMAWLVTLTATIVELYPMAEVGRAAGLIAAGSALGGMLSTEGIAALVTSHGYIPVFTLMAFLHPLALLLIWNSFHQKRSVVPALA